MEYRWRVKCPFCGVSIEMIGPNLTTHNEGDTMVLNATIEFEKHSCTEKDLAEQAIREKLNYVKRYQIDAEAKPDASGGE